MPFCPEYDKAGYEEAPGAFIGILHFTCTIKQHMYVSLAGFGRWAWLVQVAHSAHSNHIMTLTCIMSHANIWNYGFMWA